MLHNGNRTYVILHNKIYPLYSLKLKLLKIKELLTMVLTVACLLVKFKSL